MNMGPSICKKLGMKFVSSSDAYLTSEADIMVPGQFPIIQSTGIQSLHRFSVNTRTGRIFEAHHGEDPNGARALKDVLCKPVRESQFRLVNTSGPLLRR
jgi:hypothetical protein